MKKIVSSLLTFFLILAIWYSVALWVRYTKGPIFPTPLDTFIKLTGSLSGVKLYDKSIFEHFFSSLSRWTIGYMLAVAFGIPIGLLLGAFKRLHEIFMPLAYVIQLIPGLAWIPIALLIFGLGNVSTIFMIFIIGIIPIIINTTGGIIGIPNIHIRVAQMMGARKPTIFFKVMFPAASLSIINGMRIGLANAWRVLIAAEMIVGTGMGLGYIIIQSRWSLDFESAFLSIVLICLTGLFIEKFVFVAIEKEIIEKFGLTRNH